jgi:hypothetical protein
LLSTFKSIDPDERGKHEAVLEYWLSIRGDREYPALHDLDPLEISEAGPSSLLLELISGGEDADIRHCGEALKGQVEVERLSDAAPKSIAGCITKKLSLVAISRNFMAFEDEFTAKGVTTRCWVTLLPLSAAGAWVDYVYALVSFDTAEAAVVEVVEEPAAEAVEDKAEPVEAEVAEESAEVAAETEQPEEVAAEPETTEELVAKPDTPEEVAVEAEAPEAIAAEVPEPEPVEEITEEANPAEELAAGPKSVAGAGKAGPGFSKLLEDLAALGGFYKTSADKAEVAFPEPAANEEPLELEDEHTPAEPEAVQETAEPVAAEAEEPAAIEEQAEEAVAEAAPEPVATEPVNEPSPVLEGTLKTKLAEVRSKADEARQAKLRANAALYEGLSAAYDFALDAEGAPEEYLKLVEAQGLKIQLRSPMKPVVKLAFNGLCDDSTISQLEAVLAWALEQELPRGSLAGRIEEVGGIARILNGQAEAA